MIKSSLYFMFDNIKSSDMGNGIMNVSISSGLYSETLLSNREILEVEIRDRDETYHQGLKRSPLTLDVTFYFEKGWTEESIREVCRWLDVDYYKPLQFSENLDRIFYAMPVNASELLHNGNKEGYFTLTFRCKNSHSFSPIYQSNVYNLSSNSIEGTEIKLVNGGDKLIYPEIYIRKIGNGNISIANNSNGGETFELLNLIDQEEIQVIGEYEEIETSISNKERYDDHNDIYLSCPRGVNQLVIYGNCKVYFKYQFKTLA